MRAGVRLNTNARGNIRWTGVKQHMLLNNGRNMGLLQLKAKWEQLQSLPSETSLAIFDSVRPIADRRNREQ